MKKEIWASYYHNISTDIEPQHEKCDASWCAYKKAQGAGKAYKHKPSIDPDIRPLIKSVYEKLTDDTLLTRCLGGNTQNNNECYNKTLWALVPKHTYVGRNVVEIAAQISLCLCSITTRLTRRRR